MSEAEPEATERQAVVPWLVALSHSLCQPDQRHPAPPGLVALRGSSGDERGSVLLGPGQGGTQGLCSQPAGGRPSDVPRRCLAGSQLRLPGYGKSDLVCLACRGQGGTGLLHATETQAGARQGLWAVG